MAANIMLLAVLAMFLGWYVYFKIQDRKEENNNKMGNKYLWDVPVRIIPFYSSTPGLIFFLVLFCAWFFSWAACSLA